MPLPMARPAKIKDSPNRQYVARIPRDVLAKARGQTVTVEIAGKPVSFRIGPTANVIKFSLRTSDPTSARARHAAIADHLSHWFAALRTGVTTLTHRQTVALAGQVYTDWSGGMADNPGPPELWRLIQSQISAPLLTIGRQPGLEHRFGKSADVILRRHGLIIDDASRGRLLQR